MKRWSVLLHTLCYLRVKQLVYQVLHRVVKPEWRPYVVTLRTSTALSDSVAKHPCYKDGQFDFLNIQAPFVSWNDTSHGMLWAYNLNYMDWLLQPDMDFVTGAAWIDRFIQGLPDNQIGLDPYPVALRGVNWMKFMICHKVQLSSEVGRRWNNCLYAQYKLLVKKLEYHLLGNHLLEDAFSLFMASLYFQDAGFYKTSVKLLHRELSEQILPDGAHFEQSPMYHCILLDRLLDCYNFSVHNRRFDGQEQTTALLQSKAMAMLGHLESVLYADKTIPLVNDAAVDIAPVPQQLFDYASRLGLHWQALPMAECGYRKMQNELIEALVDIGGITATYQPGHSHADTFNYELRLNGRPFIVDTGISTYDKTSGRRQYERGTAAHNTVVLDGLDSTQVWGGFRVAKRAEVTVHKDTIGHIVASHNGYGRHRPVRRAFVLADKQFVVEDIVQNVDTAVSYIHFSPDVRVLDYDNNSIRTDWTDILLAGATGVELRSDFVSQRYNRLQASQVVAIHFNKTLKYIVRIH